MITEKFARKPFLVDAVQVTEDNMKEIADWCSGEIHSTDPAVAEQLKKPVQTWIKVEVHNPANERQTQAFVGDWVLYYNHKFQVFRNKSFSNTFEPVLKEKAPEPVPKPAPPRGGAQQADPITVTTGEQFQKTLDSMYPSAKSPVASDHETQEKKWVVETPGGDVIDVSERTNEDGSITLKDREILRGATSRGPGFINQSEVAPSLMADVPSIICEHGVTIPENRCFVCVPVVPGFDAPAEPLSTKHSHDPDLPLGSCKICFPDEETTEKSLQGGN